MATTVKQELLLIEYVGRYAAARNLNKATTIYGYRLAANSLGHFHGRPVRLVELTRKLVDDWSFSLVEAGFSPLNIEAMRRHIEVMWRGAYAEGLVPSAPAFRYRKACALHAGVKEALDKHLLLNDLKPTTQESYRACALVFSRWAHEDDSRQFTSMSVSEFLRDKQADGVSTHYLKSLRTALKTLLQHIDDKGKVRKVRLQPLNVAVWRGPEICRLIAAIPRAILPCSDTMKALYRRFYFRTIILAAWYSGLSYCDIITLDRSNVDLKTGRVETRRNKTQKRVVTYIPPEVLAEVDRDDGEPFWETQTSVEMFRREFARVVKAAGLIGSFKKLRKSSGTLADELQPGRGHVHLGNTRQVFEKHYQAADVHIEPIIISAPTMSGQNGGAT